MNLLWAEIVLWVKLVMGRTEHVENWPVTKHVDSGQSAWIALTDLVDMLIKALIDCIALC